MRKHRAVAFDLYGTLVDVFSRRQYDDVLRTMSRVLGVAYEEFTNLWMGETFAERNRGDFPSVRACVEYIVKRLGAEVRAEQVDEAVQARMEHVRASLRPRPDAVETLQRLKAAGMRTALVSNCSLELPALWPQCELAAWVDVAILSSAVRLRKPDPAIYRLACDGLGVPPCECLYVGDGDDGELEGARGVGMDVVLIRVPTEDPSDAFRRVDSPWEGVRVGRLSEVLPLVLKNQGED